MKSKRKYIWILLLIILLLVGVYAYREYNRRPADLYDVLSHDSISADSIVMIFESNEQKANTLYLGKAIDVTGIITGISNQKDTIVNIMLGRKDDLHKVSCLMDIKHVGDIKSYKVGDKISLRGICNGFLMDVELNRCVVIN